MTVTISYSPYFIKQFRKLPPSVRELVVKRERQFRKDIHVPSLKTHKLKGKLSEYYAFSINYQYRILFTIEPNGEVVFINIGTHQIYR